MKRRGISSFRQTNRGLTIRVLSTIIPRYQGTDRGYMKPRLVYIYIYTFSISNALKEITVINIFYVEFIYIYTPEKSSRIKKCFFPRYIFTSLKFHIRDLSNNFFFQLMIDLNPVWYLENR